MYCTTALTLIDNTKTRTHARACIRAATWTPSRMCLRLLDLSLSSHVFASLLMRPPVPCFHESLLFSLCNVLLCACCLRVHRPSPFPLPFPLPLLLSLPLTCGAEAPFLCCVYRRV